jgi:hypothetical protein
MLDTIVLTVPEREYRLRAPERFTPHAAMLRNPALGQNAALKAVCNPTKADKATGYKPRLTLLRRPYSAPVLRIEFSAPKLLFGNNFEELRGRADLPLVLDALHKALSAMGVDVPHKALEAAQVGAIHYSKNILLERTTPCFLVIQALEKLDLSAQLDLTQTDFRNGGQMAKYHAGSYEIALYDKVKDLEQAAKYGPKRGAEVNYDGAGDLFATAPRKPEVLRFEVRLTARKCKSLCGTLGFAYTPTLATLFSLDLSRAILLHYWKVITDGLYMMQIDTKDTERALHTIRAAFPRKRPGSAVQLLGFVTICQALGIRAARAAMALPSHQWYRLKRDAKTLDAAPTCPRFAVLANVRGQLKEFVGLRREDVVDEELIRNAQNI